MAGKRRTREHVIAGLGVNHVERHALLAGYTVDRFVHDYGLDLILVTYDGAGEVEPGPIFLQVKATDAPTVLRDGATIVCRIEQADLEWWLEERVPVILVVYDAGNDVAYWVHVQAYFARGPRSSPARTTATVAVHLPMANRVDAAAMRRFARLRDEERLGTEREGRRRG